MERSQARSKVIIVQLQVSSCLAWTSRHTYLWRADTLPGSARSKMRSGV
jgi:hypothetical protein